MDDMSFLQLGQLAKKIVKSPINPILFFTCVIALPLLYWATKAEGGIRITFIVIAVLLIISAYV